MPFRSGRFWSEACVELARRKRARGLAFGLALASLSLCPSVAFAAVTATTFLGGQINSPGGPSSNTFYFAGAVPVRGQPPLLSGCAPAGSFPSPAPTPAPTLANCLTYVDSGFTIFDLGASLAQDSGLTNMLQFQLTSTLTAAATSGNYYVVARAYVTQGVTTNLRYVPIAAVNGASCFGGGACSGSLGLSNAYSGTGTLMSYAAPFSVGQTVNIGIYPADLCYSSTLQGGLVQGCSSAPPANNAVGGNSVLPITDGLIPASTQIQLEFDIFTLVDPTQAPGTGTNAGGTGTGTTTGSATPTDSGTVYNLNFQGDTPTMVATDNCPNIATIYYPGDGQISVNTNFLSIDIANSDGTTRGWDTNHAPPTAIRIAAVEGPDGTSVPPTPFTSTVDAFTVASLAGKLNPMPLPLSGTQALMGFDNVTSSTNNMDLHTYQLIFMVRDATGMVAIPPAGSCQLKDVQTSEILGFLSQSQCFIATGAFRSATAAPVMLLREFRDEVLEHFALGRAFVHWYYGWSPPAALWLIDHPAFRFPVLLALLPLEWLAWLVLHPVLLLVAMSGAAVVLGFGAFAWASRELEEEPE